jgi:hypothetical protein
LRDARNVAIDLAQAGAAKAVKHRVGQIEQWAVRVLCAVALLFVGFAHQVPARADDAFNPANFAEYRLPDGTLPTLCITATDSDGTAPDHKLHAQGCEACRIGASIMLPTPTDLVGTLVAFVLFSSPSGHVEAFHQQIYPPNSRPRAPPMILS